MAMAAHMLIFYVDYMHQHAACFEKKEYVNVENKTSFKISVCQTYQVTGHTPVCTVHLNLATTVVEKITFGSLMK